MSGDGSVESLAEGVAAGDLRSIARAISAVEDRRAQAESTTVALLRAIRDRTDSERSARIGITGPPGVGKSSLVSVLAREARARGRKVGVLAIDPSSPRSGGALLGDRARIDIDPNDAGLFVRSMASGGDLGGLARAAGAAVDVLSAVFDTVLVETTGVGQSETDVEHVTDVVLMVVQPASGDVLQFLKSGIIEIPDVFAVNKSDLGGLAERAGADLIAALGSVHGPGDSAPPVLKTSTRAGTGIAELLDVLEGRRAALAAGGRLKVRRELAATRWALRLFTLMYGEYGVRTVGGSAALSRRLRELVAGGATAVEAVARTRPAYATG